VAVMTRESKKVFDVVFGRIDIRPYPTRVFGRGDWPHQNIIFPRTTSVYQIMNEKIELAYGAMRLYLSGPPVSANDEDKEN
jgi:hypothetical protein